MKPRNRPFSTAHCRQASRVAEGWGDASHLLWMTVVVGWFAVAILAVLLLAWALQDVTDIVSAVTGG